MDNQQTNTGQCSCGSVVFETTAAPICRAYCHCTICQNFNNADYADVTAYYAKDVILADESAVEFKVHKQPPLLRRGTCINCNKPAIEKLSIPLMPKLVLIPSGNIDNGERLPDPVMHIFYDKHVQAFDDGLKKYRGFLPSQIGFSVALIKSIFSAR